MCLEGMKELKGDLIFVCQSDFEDPASVSASSVEVESGESAAFLDGVSAG